MHFWGGRERKREHKERRRRIDFIVSEEGRENEIERRGETRSERRARETGKKKKRAHRSLFFFDFKKKLMN